MPVVVLDGYEELWTEQVKDANELKVYSNYDELVSLWMGRRRSY